MATEFCQLTLELSSPPLSYSYSTSKTYQLYLQNILDSELTTSQHCDCCYPVQSRHHLLLGFSSLALPSAYSQSSSQTESLKVYANPVHPVCSRPSHGFPSCSSQWPAGPCTIWPLNFLQQSSPIPRYSHRPSSQTHQAYLHLRALALAVLSASDALSQISGLMFLLPNALLKCHFLSETVLNHPI